MEKTRAKLLRDLVAESGNRAEIDALQSFTVTMGERLGVAEDVLWVWRCALVWWMSGKPVELEDCIGMMTQKELYASVADCAGAWLVDTPPTIEIAKLQEVLEAWEYTASVILPLKFED
ncbi:MAG: hypothetical protein ACKVQS_03840 [Fimbriimonadaceae bacterium]